MCISTRCGFLVTGMPLNMPDYKYYGVNTGVWPNGITSEALKDEVEKGYVDLTYPVLVDKENAVQYYANCIKSLISVRLLFCQCSSEISGCIVEKPSHTFHFKQLGFDYAYPSGDYFSSILNEVLYGKSKLAVEWGERLNQYGLLASEDDVLAYIKRRKQFIQECEEYPTLYEKGPFSVFRLFEVNL